MKTNVYLTVDTENSMGGAWADAALCPVSSALRIFCRINGEDHGIGWICKELSQRSLCATFLGEVFGSFVFGEDDTRYWFQYVLDQGQDVQLHTHLNFYYYAEYLRSAKRPLVFKTDNLADLTPALRLEVLQTACDRFRRAAGYDAVAFRAGNWCIDEGLLSDLPKVGIILDASFNAALNGRDSFAARPLNALQLIDGVWELPITVARQTLPDHAIRNGLRPFDPVSMSAWEMKTVLESAYRSGTTHVSIVFHSFSAVKAKDKQYSEMKPDRIVQARLTFLLDYLNENRDRFQVSTLRELARELSCGPPPIRTAVPELGFFHPAGRKLIQALNRSYWF